MSGDSSEKHCKWLIHFPTRRTRFSVAQASNTWSVEESSAIWCIAWIPLPDLTYFVPLCQSGAMSHLWSTTPIHIPSKARFQRVWRLPPSMFPTHRLQYTAETVSLVRHTQCFFFSLKIPDPRGCIKAYSRNHCNNNHVQDLVMLSMQKRGQQ